MKVLRFAAFTAIYSVVVMDDVDICFLESDLSVASLRLIYSI